MCYCCHMKSKVSAVSVRLFDKCGRANMKLLLKSNDLSECWVNKFPLFIRDGHNQKSVFLTASFLAKCKIILQRFSVTSEMFRRP
jgi:hypothetical protein